MSQPTPAGKQRFPVAVRLRFLRLLFGRKREVSFTRRLTMLSRRFGVSSRQAWRWVKEYRLGGVNGVRDRVRCDALTRRAPRNVKSITPGAPVRLPLSAPAVRATRTPEPRQ